MRLMNVDLLLIAAPLLHAAIHSSEWELGLAFF